MAEILERVLSLKEKQRVDQQKPSKSDRKRSVRRSPWITVKVMHPALGVAEILDHILGSLQPDRGILGSSIRKRWDANLLNPRRVNRAWKTAFDKQLVLSLVRGSRRHLSINGLPLPIRRVLSQGSPSIVVEAITWHSHVMPRRGGITNPAIVAAFGSSLRELSLDPGTIINTARYFHGVATPLQALAKLTFQARQFPAVSGSSGDASARQTLDYICSFLAGLTGLTDLDIRTVDSSGAVHRLYNDWHILTILSIPPTHVTQMSLAFSSGHGLASAKCPSNGSQVDRVLQHFAGVTSLNLIIHRYLVCFKLPSNLQTLSVICPLKMLPRILELLANPAQAPLLRNLGHIRGYEPTSNAEKGKLVGTIPRTMIDGAIAGLKARKDFQNLESAMTSLYAHVY